MIGNFLSSIELLATVQNLLLMNVSLFIGIVVGAVPGLTGMLAITLALPLTFGLDPVAGVLVLLGLYAGGVYGGSITAILINTPGSPAAAATILDGYPAAQNGKAKKALEVALYASVFGGVVSAFLLLFLSPTIARLSLLFGPAEYFAISLFGLSVISSVSGDSILKGIISGCLGILVSTIGVDAAGVGRFVFFDNFRLLGGVPLIIALIGLFALGEILINKNRPISTAAIDAAKIRQEPRLTFRELRESGRVIGLGTAIGNLIGIVPGTGGAIASFVSYSQAKRVSRRGDEFGTGCLDGVAAVESANNAATGTALIPMLSLGIPGDAAAAIMLGALTVHGLRPGPTLFSQQGPQIYAIIVGFLVVNVLMLVHGKLLVGLFARLSSISYAILAPIIMALCMAGSFAVNNTSFYLLLVTVFAVIALVMAKLEIPRSPMLLGLVLGPLIENNLRRSMAISQNTLSIFFERPVSLVFIFLAIAAFVLPAIAPYLRDRRKSKTNAA